ncbi:uncharacterized protein LOC119393044 isoform X1 [Rhipicephalus sanguineus]|uniref:Uncharacterized protein n=1 Tax=Rhipicephalus sanguineus TaxID=34632 RepID=A0A9D4PSQ1_RHISA|nr:uncharacterized protein LOC119393044 isoform X1 [Rhipicephalus sanguineus]KAH7952395.1 hypothetical protein HPB52_022195 [Rhipicephalus sanguineus]
MAELKYVQYLLEEEKVILQAIEVFQKQVNKLKVEEMNILSALRDQQIEKTDGPTQDEEVVAVDLKNPDTYVDENYEEPTNSEVIDLRVDNILDPRSTAAAMCFASQQQNVSEEEEEDEPES